MQCWDFLFALKEKQQRLHNTNTNALLSWKLWVRRDCKDVMNRNRHLWRERHSYMLRFCVLTPDMCLITILGKCALAVSLHNYEAHFRGPVLFTLLIVVLAIRDTEWHEYRTLNLQEQFFKNYFILFLK